MLEHTSFNSAPLQRNVGLSPWNGPECTTEDINLFCANGTLPRTYREHTFYSASGGEFAPIQPEAVFVFDFDSRRFEEALLRPSSPQQVTQLICGFVDQVTNLRETVGQGLPLDTEIYCTNTATAEESHLLECSQTSLDCVSFSARTPLVQAPTATDTSMLVEHAVIPSQFQGSASLLMVKFLEGKVYIDDLTSAEETTQFWANTYRAYGVEELNHGASVLSSTCGVFDIHEEVRRFVNYCYTIIRAQQWESAEEKDKPKKILSYMQMINHGETAVEASSAKAHGSRDYQKLAKDMLRNDAFLETNPQLSSTLYEFYWAILKEVQKPERPGPQNQNRSTNSDDPVPGGQRRVEVPDQSSYQQQVNLLKTLRPIDRIQQAAKLAQKLGLLDEGDTSNYGELRSTYIKVLRALHPDTFKGTDKCPTYMGEAIVKAVTEAWKSIKDEQS
jgi:hypothetical protein